MMHGTVGWLVGCDDRVPDVAKQDDMLGLADDLVMVDLDVTLCMLLRLSRDG